MKGASFKAGTGMIQFAFLPVPVPVLVPAPELELELELGLELPVLGFGAVPAPLGTLHAFEVFLHR